MLLQVVDLVVVDGRLDRDRVRELAAAGVDLARKLEHRHVEDGGEALDHPVAPLSWGVADPQLDGRAGHVADDHPAVAVEDRAARRLDPDRAQLVVLGGVEVLRAREDLQRPEPEEQDCEDDQRDDAEDADPEGEPRRQPVRRLTPSGRAGGSGARGCAAHRTRWAVRQGARPLAPARRSRSRRRASGTSRKDGLGDDQRSSADRRQQGARSARARDTRSPSMEWTP